MDMIPSYINSHIIDNAPEKKEVYSLVNFMLFGRWIVCEFGRKREIAGTSSIQVMTFTTKLDQYGALFFDVNLN